MGLGLKLTPDLKWNSYILSVAMETGKMVGSFFRSKKYLTPAAILYLYKSQIRPKMEYCCHIWSGASKSSLSSLDKVQRRLRRLVGDNLFSTLRPLSPLLHYFELVLRFAPLQLFLFPLVRLVSSIPRISTFPR